MKYSVGLMIWGQNGLQLTNYRYKFEARTAEEAEDEICRIRRDDLPEEFLFEPDEPARPEPDACFVVGK